MKKFTARERLPVNSLKHKLRETERQLRRDAPDKTSRAAAPPGKLLENLLAVEKPDNEFERMITKRGAERFQNWIDEQRDKTG